MKPRADTGRELRIPRAAGDGSHLQDLMGRIRDGSPAAFQELMDLLWAELVRYAAWEVADVDAAKDIVQEAFVYLWEHRRSWISAGSPRAYLYRIVQHQIIDLGRHKKVRSAWADREKLRPQLGPPTPAEVLAGKEVQAAFEEAVADLSPRRRDVFYLVVLRGLSHREVAEILGISAQTVANQVSAALSAVRAAIAEVSESPD